MHLYLRLSYNFILHKPMEFTNIRVDVLAMYFQVIKVEHVGLHMDYMVSRGRSVSLNSYFQHLCIVWSCMDLLVKPVVNFWDLCFVNSDSFKWSSDVFFKRHFRSFNVTLYEMPCSLHPGIQFRCHNWYFQGVTDISRVVSLVLASIRTRHLA